MVFGYDNKGKSSQESQETANVPPQISDLHCFTETEGVVTTST